MRFPKGHLRRPNSRRHTTDSHLGRDLTRVSLVGLLQRRAGKKNKCSLDVFWLRDESLEDSDNLPPPDVIAAEIVEELKAALEQFAEIHADLSASARSGLP